MRALRIAPLGLALVLAHGAVHAAAAPAPAAGPAPAAPAAQPGAPAAPSMPPEQPSSRDDREVIEASETWLALIDTGKLGAAWDVSAPTLRKVVTRADWIKGIGAARKPYGKRVSRERERFARAHSIPGAPEGDYAIIEFTTRFGEGKVATEQLTWWLDPDTAVWRVAGYHVR